MHYQRKTSPVSHQTWTKRSMAANRYKCRIWLTKLG